MVSKARLRQSVRYIELSEVWYVVLCPIISKLVLFTAVVEECKRIEMVGVLAANISACSSRS